MPKFYFPINNKNGIHFFACEASSLTLAQEILEGILRPGEYPPRVDLINNPPDCSSEIADFVTRYKSDYFSETQLTEKYSAKLNRILFWFYENINIYDVDIFQSPLLEIIDECRKWDFSCKVTEKSLLTEIQQEVNTLGLSPDQLKGKNIFQAVEFSVYVNEMREQQIQSNG